jgi:chromosome partitioning protein
LLYLTFTQFSGALNNPGLVPHTFFNALYPTSPSNSPLPLSEIIREPYGEHGHKLVPADITLGELGYKLANQPNREKVIRNWVDNQAHTGLKDFDIVLMDNAPSTSVVSRASIVAADLLLIPVRLDALTVKSIAFLASELQVLAESQLDIPQVIAVPNFFRQNSSRSARVMSTLQREFGDEVPIAPHIGESETFPKSLLFALGRELEEVLPVTFENWNRSFERQHQEIRAVANYVLEVAGSVSKRAEQGGPFDRTQGRKMVV